MKKNVIKTAFAAVCVVAAGLGGLRAYNYSTQSQANMLLAENIDAFSQGDAGEPGAIPPKTNRAWIPIDFSKSDGRIVIIERCEYRDGGEEHCPINGLLYKFFRL